MDNSLQQLEYEWERPPQAADGEYELHMLEVYYYNVPYVPAKIDYMHGGWPEEGGETEIIKVSFMECGTEIKEPPAELLEELTDYIQNRIY